MADRLAEAILEIRTDLSDTVKQLDSMKAKLEDTSKSTKNISQLFSLQEIKRWGKAGVDNVLKVGEAIADLGVRGAAVGDITGSFEALSEKAGQSADVLLGKMSEGVKETISNTDLMMMANKALGAGLVKSAEDMATLSAGARSLGKTTGIDTKTAFESLTQSIASGRTAQLRQLGLFVDSKVALEAYAKAHGIASGDLTDFQRAQALSSAAMDALRQRMQDIKPEAADFGELIDAGKAKLINFRDQLALAVSNSPVLQAGMLAIGKAVADGFGDGKDAIQVLMGVIEKLAIGLTYAADVAVSTARFIVVGFTEAKTIFSGFLSVMTGGVAQVAGLLASLAEKASGLPVVGEGFKAIEGSLTSLSITAATYSEAFQQQTNDNMAAVDAENATFDRLSEGVQKVREAMITAGDAHAKAAEKARTAAPDIAGDPILPRSIDNSAKIATLFSKLQSDLNTIGLTGVDQRIMQIESEYQAKVDEIERMKQITEAEKEAALTLAQDRWTKEVAIAQLGADQIRDTRLALEQTIALAQTTGTEQRLLQIQYAEQAEIQSLANLQIAYPVVYDQLVALVQQKYQQMTEAAQGHFDTVQQAAGAAGFQSRAELQHTAEVAQKTYEDMKRSGLYSYDTLQKAHAAAEKAKQEAQETTSLSAIQQYELIANAATSVLSAIFGKSKAAAIASIVINTAMAVMKAISQYGLPWGLVPAAASVALGAVQISKVNSQSTSGFAEGTPNLDFANFGTKFPTVLHKKEAVIPQGSGHLLAGEIADAMGDQKEPQTTGPPAGLTSGPVSLSGSIYIEGKRIGEALFELSKTGALRVQSTALVTT